MEKALFNVVYNRKKRLLSDGTALVQVEAYMRGRKKYFSTNIYITPDQWDKKHRKIKNHPNAIRLNTEIRDFVATLERVELERRNAGRPFTLDHLTDYLNGKLTSSFTKFMAMEIEQEQLSRATKIGMQTTLKALQDFKSDILFAELNFDLLSDFERYLYAKELSINTVNKYFRHIRKFVNLAINKDLFELNKYPFRKFKAKTESTKREYLTPEEIEKIEDLKLPEDKRHLRKIVDMYLFSVYSGLRFSDLTSLTRDHIVTEDGKQWIVLKMQKTKEMLRIPIYLLFDGKCIEIIERYATPNKKLIFDDFTNQYVNRCLKDIAKEAGINKTITFHQSRHTQATYLLYKGVPVTTVQKLLGHKKLQTTQIYTKVMDRTIVNDLQGVSFSR